MEVRIEFLVVSPIHAYLGRPQDGPAPDPEPIDRRKIEVRSGLGIVGDRYYGHAAHRTAAVTVLSLDALDDVEGVLEQPLDPLATRRNIQLRGFDVDTLARRRGQEHGALFSIDSGQGPVRFRAHRPASPCRWMDTALAHGAWAAMRGRGGVRCEPLTDGVLAVGPATLRVLTPAA